MFLEKVSTGIWYTRVWCLVFVGGQSALVVAVTVGGQKRCKEYGMEVVAVDVDVM